MVALKSPKNNLATAFLDHELQLLKQLQHPSIIKVIEPKLQYSCHQQAPSLVLEYAARGELWDLINNHGPCSEPAARYFFKPVIQVLKHIHNRGVAHRDIKLENILLDENLNVLLADFGVAGDANEIIPKHYGTEGYQAPEQSEGNARGVTSDLYALGVILFILVTKMPPFGYSKPEKSPLYRAINAGKVE